MARAPARGPPRPKGGNATGPEHRSPRKGATRRPVLARAGCRPVRPKRACRSGARRRAPPTPRWVVRGSPRAERGPEWRGPHNTATPRGDRGTSAPRPRPRLAPEVRASPVPKPPRCLSPWRSRRHKHRGTPTRPWTAQRAPPREDTTGYAARPAAIGESGGCAGVSSSPLKLHDGSGASNRSAAGRGAAAERRCGSAGAP